jgi:LuxR family maltose regulon positive regulatory protein
VLPLTLLAAPAGYGKTSLVAHWLESRDGLAAWLSLDAEDSDLVVFVSYFVAAVRTGFPAPALTPWTASRPGSQRRWRRSPVTSATISKRCPLAWCWSSTTTTVSVSRPTPCSTACWRTRWATHLVVITCRDPPLSLGMLRAREALTEIRMPDLQFAASDTALLFERCVPGVRCRPPS